MRRVLKEINRESLILNVPNNFDEVIQLSQKFSQIMVKVQEI